MPLLAMVGLSKQPAVRRFPDGASGPLTCPCSILDYPPLAFLTLLHISTTSSGARTDVHERCATPKHGGTREAHTLLRGSLGRLFNILQRPEWACVSANPQS